MKLTAEEKQGLSPAEIEALEGAGADEALATMGDTVLDTPAKAKPAAAADQADDATGEDAADAGADDADDTESADADPQADAATLTAEQLAAIAKDAEPAATLPKFDVPERDFAAERKALRDSRKEIQAKWDQGELSDEELQAQLDAVDDQLEALATERARADTLKAINEQAARDAQAKIDAEYSNATTAIIKAAAASTTAKVDYLKDQAAQRQFDMALDMLQADPENAGKTPTQLVREAHRAVLIIRGLPTGAPATAPAPTPAAGAPKPPRNVPMGIGHLPNASPVPVQDETLAQAQNLSGEDLEQYMARLSPSQLAKLMKTVDRQSGAMH